MSDAPFTDAELHTIAEAAFDGLRLTHACELADRAGRGEAEIRFADGQVLGRALAQGSAI